MTKVKVKFHGVIRDITHAPTTEIELKDGATVKDLLDNLHQKYGRDFYDRVLDDMVGVRTYVRLFLNNEEVDNTKLDTTKVVVDGSAAEAMLYVMPASTGG